MAFGTCHTERVVRGIQKMKESRISIKNSHLSYLIHGLFFDVQHASSSYVILFLLFLAEIKGNCVKFPSLALHCCVFTIEIQINLLFIIHLACNHDPPPQYRYCDGF